MAATEPTARLQISPGAVTVIDAGGAPMRLPNLWLRDNCDCDLCRVSQTGEKQFMLATVDVDLAPREVALDGDVLSLVWPDGHETCYRLDAVRALRATRRPRWRPWGPGFAPRTIPWGALTANGSRTIDALTAFLTDGVIVIVDAPRRRGALESLADCLGPLREVEFDRVHDVQVDAGGYNVAHTSEALPPHNDFASYTWPPSVQALHMLHNDAAGGESVIVDGFALLERYRAEHPRFFERLCRTDVPFSMFDDDTVTWAAAPLVRLDRAGRVDGLRFSNQLMQSLDPTGDGVAEFYRAYHELCRRVMSGRHRVRFRLEAGQALLVAAHRVLHAREAFESGGRRHLQDAYFELDNIVNRRVVLQRKRETGDD